MDIHFLFSILFVSNIILFLAFSQSSSLLYLFHIILYLQCQHLTCISPIVIDFFLSECFLHSPFLNSSIPLLYLPFHSFIPDFFCSFSSISSSILHLPYPSILYLQHLPASFNFPYYPPNPPLSFSSISSSISLSSIKSSIPYLPFFIFLWVKSSKSLTSLFTSIYKMLKWCWPHCPPPWAPGSLWWWRSPSSTGRSCWHWRRRPSGSSVPPPDCPSAPPHLQVVIVTLSDKV